MFNTCNIFVLKQNIPMEVWLLPRVLTQRLLTAMTSLIECEIKYDERTKDQEVLRLDSKAVAHADMEPFKVSLAP